MPPAVHLVLATQGAVPEKQVALQALLAGARALPDVELRQPGAQPADAQQPGAQPAESRGPLIRAPLLPAQGECPEQQLPMVKKWMPMFSEFLSQQFKQLFQKIIIVLLSNFLE